MKDLPHRYGNNILLPHQRSFYFADVETRYRKIGGIVMRGFIIGILVA